ncbi:sigma-54-dependent transcriptional regulator [Psychrobacter sp. DM4]|uniref:sigma-54-dependent transcriptional regulator n=1 Tax=Psychrobacter sp. DM4 TaxID=3440637 RepID=UPI003F50C97B
MTTTALVVDDEVDLCRLMQITLTKMGIKSDVAYTLAQAKDYWQENRYDFCLTDLNLPDGSGLELVKLISNSSTSPVAVITAHGSMDLAIEALKIGAFDFVNKPLELPRLRQLVENALKVIHRDHQSEITLESSPEQRILDERLIGNSEVMLTLKKTVLKLARSQAPVFLSGASGTGKEVVARLIHDLSPRREGSFVAVNCGAIPSELMESEFFGHKKGSFTGAVADKQGLFQQANGGTLFLDEVADLPLAMQVKLLRAIQEKTVRAIGDTKEAPVDIRILSATHKDLDRLVKEGTFRQDLYYRINVIELKLPALNTRRDDIPVLTAHFLGLIAREWQLEVEPTITDEACHRLQQHEFAGNVRELRNLLERAITLADSSVIDTNHLGLSDLSAVEQVVSLKADDDNSIHVSGRTIEQSDDSDTGQGFAHAYPYRTTTQHYPSSVKHISANEHGTVNVNSSVDDQNLNTSKTEQTASTAIQTQETIAAITDPQLPQEGLEQYLLEQEKQLILTALKQTDWNKTQAAERLGTTFRSLRYRMKKLDIAENKQ